MAQKVQLVMTCDLDEEETPAVQTVTFGYEGESYAFELCQQHLDEFTKMMETWTNAGRKTRPSEDGRRARRGAGAKQGATKQPRASRAAELAEIREWARSTGRKVSDRGRVPQAIIEAYWASRDGGS